MHYLPTYLLIWNEEIEIAYITNAHHSRVVNAYNLRGLFNNHLIAVAFIIHVDGIITHCIFNMTISCGCNEMHTFV